MSEGLGIEVEILFGKGYGQGKNWNGKPGPEGSPYKKKNNHIY